MKTNLIKLILLTSCSIVILYSFAIFILSSSLIFVKYEQSDSDIADLLATVNGFENDLERIKMEMKVSIDDVDEAVRRFEHPQRENQNFWKIKPLMHNPYLCSKVPNRQMDDKSTKENDGWMELPEEVEVDHSINWIMYVHSSVKNTELRQIIRKTWGQPDLFKNYKSKIIFAVGRPQNAHWQRKLNLEFEIFKDILQGDFMDTYKNLTYKAVFTLKWVSLYCKHVPIVMKADDDSFLNIFQLKHYLIYNLSRSNDDNQGFSDGKSTTTAKINYNGDDNLKILCPVYGDNVMPILRDKKTCMKWCVDKHDLPGRTGFPTYCSGIAYFFTQELVQKMVQHIQTTPYFWIDDVYITGLLPMKIPNVKYLSISDETILDNKQAFSEYRNNTLPIRYNVVHLGDTKAFAILWNILLKRLTIADLNSLTKSRDDLKVQAFSL
ncbi:hypothetical protein HELRODRAFT_160790 [Helobdella robusta]|uniref:Hexosyltransferase n=1 Tax=Helobdella robusta TaxID=6412 RepID=T1EQQ4_HELRO|nr:hypothetical protein HELRODRAFT_160790 [Helobdella robusta]ESO06601.1 hypothetical protein HELRODRAFT_160790 [Helobdella robusta]